MHRLEIRIEGTADQARALFEALILDGLKARVAAAGGGEILHYVTDDIPANPPDRSTA